ncbi:class II aldolase/adducin family protein [Pseudonocardia sp. GCM10023141]|uniref:class II aldolase/adducin family protein n=1 Tax=Pseudonocardia sp. GCM10023141 TaxID=3252653 RepID=UPI0036182F03
MTARHDVVAACHRLAAAGLLIGTAGNVSVRTGDEVAITATGVVLGAATPADVTIVALDGTIVDGTLAPTSELELHLGVYRELGAGAVVHTHAPVSTAMSCVLDELPVIHYQMLLLGGAVRVAPFHAFGTPELAAAVLDALDGKLAALMANHGSVTHAATLDGAVENALLLEWACAVYRDAAVVGTPRTLDESQQLAVVEAALSRGYGRTHTLDEEKKP